jgi:hypothetical protein
VDDSGLHTVTQRAVRWSWNLARRSALSLILGGWMAMLASSAMAQNDWQFPDPYFGIPQPANPAAASIQRRYRAEIGPPAVRPQPSHARHPQRTWRGRPRRDR